MLLKNSAQTEARLVYDSAMRSKCRDADTHRVAEICVSNSRTFLGFWKNLCHRKWTLALPSMHLRASHDLSEFLVINGASTLMMLADVNNSLLLRRQMHRRTAYR